MKEINVSVIIPVYNVEDYIEECIKSLLRQSLKEIEFIFVDDGSNDNSVNIIKKQYNNSNGKVNFINIKREINIIYELNNLR